MFTYNKVYRGVFRNQEVDSDNNSLTVDVNVDIYDTTSGIADPSTEIIELEMSGEPVVLQTIDNEEDKMGVKVRAKSATVKIYSNDNVGIETFIDGGDTKFFAVIYIGDFIIIRGFVSVADVHELFQPDVNEISLVINDGLGWLDDEDFTDEDGNIPSGMKTIGYMVHRCLLKTGQSEAIYIGFNIREQTANTINDTDNNEGHFFQHEYIDVRSGEGSNPGTMIKCREILDKILVGATLFQTNGVWYIVRMDEIQSDSSIYFAQMDTDGTLSPTTQINPTKSIGINEDMFWRDDDCDVSGQRAIRKLDLKRLYENFKELVCNIDWERWDGTDPTGAASETIDGNPECWQFLREGSAVADYDQDPFSGSIGVLRKEYENNYEKRRYLVTQQAGGFRHYFKSEGMSFDLGAKMDISVQYAFNTDIGAATINVMHIRLIGNDGTIYDLSRDINNVQAWTARTFTDGLFFNTIQEDISASTDMTDPHSFSFTTIPAPVTGKLYIRLLNDLASPTIRYFFSIQITYLPKINGSYAKFTGESFIVEQTGDNKAVREDDIFLGSGPSTNVKWVLHKRATNQIIYSGPVTFGNANNFDVPGSVLNIFTAGMEIIITGSALTNNITGTIISVTYVPGDDLTAIIVDQTTEIEVDVDVVISIPTYELATGFYSAAPFPDGPPDETYVHPYGELIAYDMWNQYRRVMRLFDGNIEGLDTGNTPEAPSLIHKYSMTDSNVNSNNRIFILLSMTQDFHECKWKGFFAEVYSSVEGKSYVGLSFKYLTE